VIENLKDSYSEQKVEINHHIEHSLLNINTAISLGVILNELITNSIKHSHTNQTKIEILFRVYPEKKVLLFTENNKQLNTQTEMQKGMGLAIIEEFSQKISNSWYTLSYKFGTEYILELYEVS
jgi:two-component sensor histidine kinase